MIELSTLITNSILNNEIETDLHLNEISEAEMKFYELIKPTLNQLVKNPSAESVQKVTDFSKLL